MSRALTEILLREIASIEGVIDSKSHEIHALTAERDAMRRRSDAAKEILATLEAEKDARAAVRAARRRST